MRKKYLSALLFGALLFVSAGTFTSCKDYDDDINNLQSQITANADAIKALQDLVNNGDYVTNIEKSAEGLVVTFKNAGAQTITLEDKVGSVVTVNEEGVLCIDGEPTDIKAATADPDGEATKSQIIIGEDNCWQVLQEDGTYKTTNIPVSGVNVSGSEAEGYTLTIFDETGTPTTVKLPSAASALTEILIADGTGTKSEVKAVFGYAVFDGTAATNANFRANWKGAKTLPANGSYIVRLTEGATGAADKIKIRVNPIDVDASLVTFKLSNSLNEDLPAVTFAADPENDQALSTPDGRAAAKGGLYTLSLNDAILGSSNEWSTFTQKAGVALAVNPNATIRSEYKIQGSVNSTEIGALTNVQLVGEDGTALTGSSAPTNGTAVTAPTTGRITVDKNGTYTIVNATNYEGNRIYDVMFSADQEAINNYGLTFDPATKSFTVGRDIDTSTSGEFSLDVTVVDIQGNATTITYNFELSDKVVDDTEYTTVKHAVETDDNVFGIDLSIMKQGMNAEELNTWKTRVDFGATEYAIYGSLNDAKNESSAISAYGSGKVLPVAYVTEKIDKNATSNVSTKDKANYISVRVDDSQAGILKLFTTYYLRVNFKSGSSATTPLNSIIVPVEFTAPTVAEQYKAKSGLEKDGVVYGFMSGQQSFTGITGTRPAYAIESAFEKTAAGATYTVTDDLIDGMNNIKSSAKFVQEVIGTSGAYVGFKDAVPGKDQVQDAYAKAFTLKAYSDDYGKWKYPTDSKYTDYKFKMTLMSPIYDGSFAEGTTLTVNGGQDFKFTNDQLKFSDYNNTPVKILQDAYTSGSGAWSDTRIAKVTPEDDNDMLDNEGKLAIIDADWDDKVIEGYITGKAGSVAVDGTENLHIIIKDNMGYERTFKIPVTIKANK